MRAPSLVCGMHTGPRPVLTLPLPARYAVLVCVSGDGMVHEVLNGLAKRGGSVASVPPGSRGIVPDSMRCIPLCVLPGGTSNGMATSTSNRDVFLACRSLLEGSPQPVQVVSVNPLGEGKGRLHQAAAWDAHVFSWAIVAQHDHLAERHLRWMGKGLKQLYCPIHVILQRRVYSGRITMLPADPAMVPSNYSDPEKLPAASQAGWRVLEADDIVLFSSTTMPWASHDSCFARGIHVNQGAMDLVLIRGASRLQLVKTFLAIETGAHVDHPWVEVYRVTSYTLEPSPRHTLDLDLSGENYPSQPVRVDCHKSAGLMWYTEGSFEWN